MLKPATKNLLRALQDRSHNKSQITAHNNLRKNILPEEAVHVETQIRDNTLYNHLSIPPEFPKLAPNFERYIRLAQRPVESEIAALSARISKHQTKIILALKDLKELDRKISGGKYEEAQGGIISFHDNYGYSFALTRRIAYLATVTDQGSPVSAYCIAYLQKLGLDRKNLIILSLLDTLGETYDLFIIKKGVHSINSHRGERQFTVDVTKFVHTPIPPSDTIFSSTLQSFLQYSILDATIYFCINYFNAQTVPDQLRTSEYATEIRSILGHAWWDLYNRLDDDFNLDHDDDYKFYRRSITWIEYLPVTRFRQAVDPFYVDPDMRAAQHYKDSRQRIDYLSAYFSGVSEINHLTAPLDQSPFSLERFSASHSGTFTRTIGFLHLLEASYGNLEVSSNDLLELMNSTRDLVNIGNRAYLETLGKKNNDDLTLFILICLISRKSKKDSDSFILRRLLQSILLKDHNGNIIDFLNSLEATAPAVADFVYEICDETFLSQLFRIYSETDEFFEARASMHEWYGKARGEVAYEDRAKTLRVDLRLQKVRGELDDTRIYVDPSRFLEWAHDKLFVELSSVLKLKIAIAVNLLLLPEGGGDLPHQDSPERRLALIVSDAFREFINNTMFGVASYLGRRIRHGTLKGVMASPVNSLRDDQRFSVLFLNAEFARAFYYWNSQYIAGLDDLAINYLQVHSSKKAKGLLDADVFRKDRADILRAALMEMITTYDRTKSFSSVNAVLYSYCWRMAEPDLKRIRDHLNSSKHQWGSIAELRRHLPSQHDAIGRAFLRELGQLMEDRFRTVIGWFKQPTNLSPTAPLQLLFDAVMSEVRETYPNFTPTYDGTPSTEITLSGGMYHLLYDALYVVLYNAAKHGKNSGRLSYDFSVESSPSRGRELLVLVSSEIRDEDTESSVMNSIHSALKGNFDDALVIEGKSGFKKLNRMLNDEGEMTGMEINIKSRCVEVVCRYRLVY